MERDPVFKTLQRVFERVFAKDQARLDLQSTSQTILGWNSFNYVRVIVELETLYGIELDGPEIDEVEDVGGLVRLLKRKIAEKAVR